MRGVTQGDAVEPVAAMLADVLAVVRESVVITDAAGEILAASRGAEARLGSGASLTGTALTALVDRRTARFVREALRSPDEGARASARLLPREGEPFDATLSLRRSGEHRVWHVAALPVQDLLEALSDGVFVVDPALTVSSANRGARRLLQLVVGEPLPPRWLGFDLDSFATALFHPGAVHAEARVEGDGEASYALTGLPTAARDFAVVVVADTSRQSLRERLEQEFVVNAAHELQTPLTAIVGLVEALTGGSPVADDVRDRFYLHLRRETQRLTRLVDALLLLARLGAAEPFEAEPVHLGRLLEQVADELEPDAGVEVTVDVPSRLVVHSHHGLLAAVVTNLAQNAARHTASGRITLRATGGGGGAVVEVEDTGAGMDADTRGRAFDRFYKGAPGSAGFGLGLTIAFGAAEALGGELELESAPGTGTLARLVVPSRETG